MERLCKHVFKHWSWISNAMSCLKGTRIHRRPLWNGLCLHKNYINNRPWCLLGDFNASLFVEDTSMGSSALDITMREFKECVETMEVMDVQRTGL
ncbi:RNA-directed DNA polymerase, eukaryota, reverse transcriptase zinc-binding domain protein, partial [Tanacetum coccineum]